MMLWCLWEVSSVLLPDCLLLKLVGCYFWFCCLPLFYCMLFGFMLFCDYFEVLCNYAFMLAVHGLILFILFVVFCLFEVVLNFLWFCVLWVGRFVCVVLIC